MSNQKRFPQFADKHQAPAARLVRKEPVKIPATLDEAVESLTKNLAAEKRAEVLALSEKDFVGRNHFFLGMALRNGWGLWTGSPLKDWFVAAGIECADDMSGIILRSMHRALSDKPRNFDAQVKDVIDWYKKNPPAPNFKRKRV